uniref:Uncharacterized HTH-type transcriptional regulator in dhlA 5'region n=4 Tax=Xanthobacteraceae TaxID=335928 RepID=YDH1_XANAU|nr:MULTISPECIES: TetR/AcrR family transcriptional regulator [Xanthobacteraceae]P22645.1 RecName: Full=Uncharacterized HTH-type transcriptional regulator in dhlA 5'region [Xanthobacter autotrophicus]AAA88690.1 unknown protein [Xanthobacter autotrophicus]ANC67841.1 TetR family transcriptional regulator [Ancylobacter novellus]ANC67906.1 TetR family transcriptional regulator [Xanthobacter autotrophicus]ANC67931.1 TetR family transcriptional regulator [Xanthobacter flavus]
MSTFFEPENGMKQNAKTERILDVALELLETEGEFGLTMRQVATQADMSLSNVQYYFKSEDLLLVAMADRYFQRCLTTMAEHPPLSAGRDQHAQLRALLRELLGHGLEISEMCRIFREYWAIATRNETVHGYLKSYYRDLAEVMAEKLAPLASSEKALAVAVSLVIPYVEGYSVTAIAMPESIDTISETLTNVVLEQLRISNS